MLWIYNFMITCMLLFFINPFAKNPWFLRVCSTSLLKPLWEKEKLLVTSNFSFSRSVFYPFGQLSAIFIKFEIVVCKLFHCGKSLKFVVWERVKSLLSEYGSTFTNRTEQQNRTNFILRQVHSCT